MKTFNKAVVAGAVLMLTAGPVLSAPDGKLSWFSDTPFAGVGTVGVLEPRPLNPADYTSFGINLYSSRQSALDEGYPAEAPDISLDANTVRLYGEVESSRSGAGSFSSPDGMAPGRLNVFGVSWQHRLDATHSFAVSAEYGEGMAVYPHPLETLDTRAAFSWTSVLPSAFRPSLTGSVFLGDEMARDEMYRHLDRKYYGFSIGGSLTLFQSHTPYVSFRMQRSLYDSVEDSSLLPRSTDRSLLSAGWKWQAGRDFSLQAEASFGLGDSPNGSLDPYSLERSRILFGTRFGFK